MFDPLRAKARVITTVALGFFGGLALASALGWTGPSYAMPVLAEAPQISADAVRPALDLSEAFANVAESVIPAVVRIEVTAVRRVQTRSMPLPEGMPEEFRPFFENPQGRGEVPSMGGGSGFIISASGYILTNNHVVEAADDIRVYLNDGRYFTASVVGTDPTTDVAVIKIEEEGLPHLSLGNSNDLRVGEWVLAVGNPGFAGGGAADLDYTVTAGIVSAKGRSLRLIFQELQQDPASGLDPRFAIEDFIQTDAVINRGNSGGPMVNLQGEVVGINSAIMSATGYYAGYGFAIPVDLAQRVMEDLIEYGRVRRAWLGVSINPVAPEDQEAYDLPMVAGVLVQEATEGSPAEDAGLGQGDVIYSVDGTVVYTPSGLQNLIAQKRPRDQVTLTVYRDGSPRTVPIRLAEAPLTAVQRPEPEPETPPAEEKLGIGVQELTPELAQQLGYTEAGGVVVSQVTPLGPASRRGVGRGQKLLEVNGQAVNSSDDLGRILEKVGAGEVVSLLLGFPDGTSQILNVRTAG
ncbi:trypsin-like peptidase domain-containing protein [Gemmatimonadota bacterium]